MDIYDRVLSKAQQRTKTTKEIASSLREKDGAIYIEEIRKGDKVIHDMKSHCRRVAIFTALVLMAQLELFLPKISSVFEYVSMPFYAQFLASLASIANRWAFILGGLILLDVVLWLCRPEAWEHFLIKAPFVRKVMLPLYCYRYYQSRAFGVNNEQSTKSTGNTSFSLEEDGMTEINIKEAYPLLGLAIALERKKGSLSRDEYKELSQHIFGYLEEASFDFKEHFSYLCMGSVLMVMLLMMAVFWGSI